MNDIVIVGGGHAGAQLCVQLAAEGLGARVRLIGAEPQLPYQRPPLSKQFLKSQAESLQTQRDAAWFAAQSIQTHLGDPVEGIDRELRCLTLASGMVISYGHLVLATGTRARRLSWLPPVLQNVTVLRDAADASNLRDRLNRLLTTGKPLTVLGGGFIGLEVAATARLMGLQVRVIEAGPRLLSRSVSPRLAEFVLAQHHAAGIEVHLNSTVSSPEINGEHLVGWHLNGHFETIDELLSGIGGLPETGLAELAGLEVDDGILVDQQMRSSDPRILAIGDCARVSLLSDTDKGHRLRLESV
jgi:3-phenylpropionate/trans-cinnamate dioxygenase ferredoxin reductase subunit